MIVPKYWAEAKTKAKFEGRQYTIKRFGWSDEILKRLSSMPSNESLRRLNNLK